MLVSGGGGGGGGLKSKCEFHTFNWGQIRLNIRILIQMVEHVMADGLLILQLITEKHEFSQ